MASPISAGTSSTIRVGTFNVENLFARYNFRKNFEPSEDGFTINNLAFDIFDETEKRITAEAILTADADILALQEVESLPVLDRFVSRYLPRMRYTHRILVDAFDPRCIDVAILSRYPIQNVRTHRDERSASSHAPLFSRDCLEVDVNVGGKMLTLYVNHFKSMMGGRQQTHARRVEQVKRVVEILDGAWKPRGYDGNFLVLGDFNDYLEGNSSLTPLAKHPHLVNIVEQRDGDDRWTHYYAGGKEYRQLDYVLMPKAFFDRAGKPVPDILRKGLPWRAERYTGPRFDGVGEDNPKASDHAPVLVDIPIAALV